MKICHLQVDHRSENNNIDRQNPVFGWRVEAGPEGLRLLAKFIPALL